MAKEMHKTIHGNEFETPQWLFDSLNKEFGFIFDLAASKENHKCDYYYTKENDALMQNWHELAFTQLGEWLWLNPPYSPLKPWIQKAQEENRMGAKIVVLCPPIITTRYFQEYLPSEIRFIVGRVPFLLNGKEMKSNTNDSCLLIYDTKVRQPKITYIERDNMRTDTTPKSEEGDEV